MKQNLLFLIENFLDVKPLNKHRLLFEKLKNIRLTHYKKTGRKLIQKECILNALIYKILKSIPNLTQLHQELEDNLSVALCCGFDILKTTPNIERLSAFLKNTTNKELVNIGNQFINL